MEKKGIWYKTEKHSKVDLKLKRSQQSELDEAGSCFPKF